MGEQDRREDALAPGHWRVTAQPYAPPVPASPSPTSPPSQGGYASPPVVPARGGGHPLIATAICAGILLLWLMGRRLLHPDTGNNIIAYAFGVAIAGAFFGLVLWAIAFAITIRKASTRWKWGSLAIVAAVGALVALSKIAPSGAAVPVGPVQVQVPAAHQGK